jgi:2-polyprenyl-3-methyl-5-hydroxy-6-metoxy-1,4-benzoquinol methylase
MNNYQQKPGLGASNFESSQGKLKPNRDRLFDQFHSQGMKTTKQFSSLEDNIKNIASNYDWNYKDLLPADKNAKILDLGCGLGQFLYWLKAQGYSNFLGVDVSREMLELCRKNVTDKLAKINSINEFLRDKNGTYDLIALNDVIEHLPKNEIIEDLEIIKAALKPGGRLIIKTNNLAAITGVRLRYADFTHEVGFTEYSLKQVLLLVGFSSIEIKPFAMPLTNPFRYARFIMQKISNLCWKLMFWINFTPVPDIVDEMIFAIAKK